MGEFIEFIFGNLFLVFVIIAGMFSFITRMFSNTQKNEREKTTSSSERGTPVREIMRRAQEALENLEGEPSGTEQRKTSNKPAKPLGKLATEGVNQRYSFEHERNEQYER